MSLTPRRRVLCALNHEEPDRVPLMIGTSGATTVLGGGYVAAAVHCLQPDVPPANIVAMCEEVTVAGRYPLQV